MADKKEYRFYGFGNYYLSSIQQGIQSAHVVGDLCTNYKVGTKKYKQVNVWAKNHKTMVLLNGGNAQMLAELFAFFKAKEKEGMPFPFAKFHEDEQSLGGALTYVGIVLPNYIYDGAAQLRKKQTLANEDELKDWEKSLMEQLNFYDLAK